MGGDEGDEAAELAGLDGLLAGTQPVELLNRVRWLGYAAFPGNCGRAVD